MLPRNNYRADNKDRAVCSNNDADNKRQREIVDNRSAEKEQTYDDEQGCKACQHSPSDCLIEGAVDEVVELLSEENPRVLREYGRRQRLYR